MIAPELHTDTDEIKLIAPSVERDAALSVGWLRGENGRGTLKLMGVTDAENTQPTLAQEKERVNSFITRQDQLNWMIECEGTVVGSIWVDLGPTQYLGAPSVHIMIGDVSERGKGIGKAATRAVLDYLIQQGKRKIYSRHLIGNEPIKRLFEKLGFKEIGSSYADKDELFWQNVVLDIE